MDERVLLGEGREAEVYLQPDGTVLKLLRDPGHGERVEREAAAMAALATTGAGGPAVLDLVTVDERPGIVMSRVEGTDLLHLLEARPLAVLRAARVLADTHVALHGAPAPAGLPDAHAQLRERIDRADALSAAQRRDVLDVLDGLPAGDRLCHGDFHLGNLLGSWEHAVVIDWGCAASGDPVGDVARSVLLHRVGVMPPGTSPLFAALARVGRRLLTGRYLRLYRRQRPVDQALFDRWYVVHAAARLGEPVEDEHGLLLALLHRQLPALR